MSAGTLVTPVAHVGSRDLVTVAGPEAIAYLQGQVAQDVAGLAVGDSAWTLVLQPTGKVVSWCRAQRTGDDAVTLDVDAGHGEALADRLRRFLLRTRAEVGVEPGVRWVAVRAAPDHPLGRPEGGLPIAWPGTSGYDLLGDHPVPAGVVEVDATTFSALRIRAGVPALGAELTDATIPAEAGQWLVDASVSFTKGCYTGQELVARIDSRGGNVPRPIRGLVADTALAAGAEVTFDGKAVGHVTSAAPLGPHGGGWVALAALARVVGPGETVTVATPDGGTAVATVAELPLR